MLEMIGLTDYLLIMEHGKLSQTDRREMNFSMRLSFLVGLIMLLSKTYAYAITGSTAILSDAAESVVHVLAVGFATYSMWFSFKPADENHPYGHEKIGFFSAGFEGAIIILASLFIFYESISKIIFGVELENIGLGILFIVAATVINLILSLYLIRKGKKHKSLILEANGKHILTDSWTSFTAIIALILVRLTGIALFDPIIAILAGANIFWMGTKLMKKSVGGLMDQIDPLLHKQIIGTLRKETEKKGLGFHHLRVRSLGHKILIEFHLLFPHDQMLGEAHDTASQIEHSLMNSVEIEAEVLTHLELKKHHDAIHKKYGLPI